ncbi:MAG: helix-turn-helix domain-containing protein [Candidatus Harrisonbacteria bacterium]|nr:helix-turn-helix domain-containing protein [Candidatus Harrisonbacteria bacterium]
MLTIRKEKYLAIKLRKQNKSYDEINKILGISKSTLAGWLKNDPSSKKAKLFLNSKSNKKVAERIQKFVEENRKRHENRRKDIRNEAIKQFEILQKDHLFIAGTMLYWAEGDNKLGNPFRLTNTDPRMISLYIKYLIKILNISEKEIRPAIILYPDLLERECIKFWSKITGVNSSQFYKTQFIKGKHPTKRLSHGICMINCNNRPTKQKILAWIDLLSKTL